jgi:GDP-L-fucose synthase
MIDKQSRILVLGGGGLVGSALLRALKAAGFSRILHPTSKELDLTDRKATETYFEKHPIERVFLAAARVGGILENATHPAEFLHTNLVIEANAIHAAYRGKVKRLLFLGSSCLYPTTSPIPIPESALLNGPLEPTNEAYAIAKIAGVKMCDYYRSQYGCDFISAIPANTFGPNDCFDLDAAHLIPALIRKFDSAKADGAAQVTLWGSGRPLRQFIYVDDLAQACLFLMEHYSGPGPINIGPGEELSVADIAERIRRLVGFTGAITHDRSKPDGVARKALDATRIAALGWKPQVSLEDGLAHTYAWYRENRKG